MGQRHKQRKREREMRLIVEALRPRLPLNARILEFGSGAGYQLPYLKELGNVTASDVMRRAPIEERYGVPFHECSIADTPFPDGAFDLLFSNHVIEHIDDLPPAFAEMKRIGTDECVYAFSVPTALWLVLSIPAQYANLAVAAWRRLGRKPVQGSGGEQGVTRESAPRMSRFLPGGHGEYRSFSTAFRTFRVGAWKRLFARHGFHLTEVRPLLLYAASEFPIIPTMRWPARLGLASSVLFILKKGPT